jgi:hypothetical protein
MYGLGQHYEPRQKILMAKHFIFTITLKAAKNRLSVLPKQN